MSRQVTERFVITGKLVAETPVHAGGIDGNPATDMPLSVNGLGEVYVPGTSLAGPMRHWLIDAFDEERVQTFWGRIAKRNPPGEKGHASFVTIADAKVTLPGKSSTEVRDGVGIDRIYGAAANGIKFDREVLPIGTTITFDMIFETDKDQRGKGEIRALLEALVCGDIRLGAAKTRGLGKVMLDKAFSVKHFNLKSPSSILDMLEGKFGTGGTNNGLDLLGGSKPTARPRISIAIAWKPRGPVMVKASADGIGVDMMPLITNSGNGSLAAVIPGASSKGALRSQSERILATVLGSSLAANTPFIDQLSRLPLIETMYGAVKKKVAVKQSQSGRGALSIDDCLAKVQLTEAEWTGIADKWRDEPGNTAIPTAVRQTLGVGMHVAIDRWTGGAADGALFAAAEPEFAWNPINIEIDVGRLVPGDKECAARIPYFKHAALALLLLTLRDMVDGLVPLGFGVNRGYGDIKIETLTISITNMDADLKIAAIDKLQIRKVGQDRATFNDPAKIGALDAAWQAYWQAPAAAPPEVVEQA